MKSEILILTVSFVDLMFFLFLIGKIKINGGYFGNLLDSLIVYRINGKGMTSYLYEFIHKSISLVFILLILNIVLTSTLSNVLYIFIFSVVSVVFILEYNFEINKFIFENAHGNNIDYEKFDESEKESFKEFKDILTPKPISVFRRAKRLFREYFKGIFHDFEMLFKFSTNNKEIFDSVEYLNSIVSEGKMNSADLKKYIDVFGKRILTDVLLLTLSVLIFLV